MTVAVVVAVAIGAALWVREWRRPPEDTAARQRLLRELRRHNTELWEQDAA